MGLTAWQGDVVRRADVGIAKNYLREPEITELNRIVTMFLDFAEDQARRRKQIFLRDWRQRLDEFLRFHERTVLPDAGRVTREEADRKAQAGYDAFALRRRAALEAQGEAELLRDVNALEQHAERKTPPNRKPSKK
jgi:hypothetical protein